MANGDVTLTIAFSGTTTSGDAVPVISESLTTASVADFFYRVYAVGTTVTSLISVGTAAGDTLAALTCLFVQNQDSTNFVTVGLIDTGVKSLYIEVPPGGYLLINGDEIDCDDDTGAALGTLTGIDTVTLKADTAACSCKIVAY